LLLSALLSLAAVLAWTGVGALPAVFAAVYGPTAVHLQRSLADSSVQGSAQQFQRMARLQKNDRLLFIDCFRVDDTHSATADD
jgi:hypothetical protein